MIISPTDGSVWMSPDDNPGRIRFTPGNNPPESCVSEVYNVPTALARPRGIDVDSKGVAWTAFSASSDAVSFDRTKCTVTSGPTANGDHCKEGWKVYPIPGPTFENTNFKTDFHYYNWVDSFDTLGLGRDIPITHWFVVGFPHRLETGVRRVHHAARAVSDGIPCTRGRWSHR